MQIKKFGIAVALVAIASCGSDTSNESGSTLDRKTLTDETQKAIDDLHWPNGKAPSAELVLGPELKRADGGDESVTWQTGFGRMQASLYYECIWAIQVLDAPDEATRGKYLEQLASDQTYVEWQSSAPDFKAMIDESQRAAAAGDLSAIESAVATGGCRDWEAGVFH